MTSIHHYTAQEAIDYIQQHTTLFAPDARLSARTVTEQVGESDGYVNIIHVVKDVDSQKSVALKQVLPYVRAVQEAGGHFPLPMSRMNVETAVFQLWRSLSPELIPDVYWKDVENGILIMEDLSKFKLLRFSLMRQQQFSHVPAALGSFLGKSAFYFSDQYLEPALKHELTQALANPQMHALFDHFIFEETFFHKTAINPLVEDEVIHLLADKALQREVLLLRNRYNTCPQTIIHNDFHTSNICVGETAVKIFDAESATFGPTGFDLGRLIGNLILNYASWEGIDTITPAEKADFRDYLLGFITEVYQQFAQTFSSHWLAEARPEYRGVESFLDSYLRQVLQDLVGYAGCVCLARIYDQAECYEYQMFRTVEQKADAQRLAIRLTKALIMNRTQIETIHDLTALIEETAFAYRLKKVVVQVISRQLPDL